MRLLKGILPFLSATALFGTAAWYRPGDSGHAIGILSMKGGRARHPVHMAAGRERYTVVVTGTVLPPYAGDVRVVVEGDPAPSFDVHGSGPIVDLGVRRRPSLDGLRLTGLLPGDRFTLWVVIRPAEAAVRPAGRYDITFYDEATRVPVLRLPVVFREQEDGCHES